MSLEDDKVSLLWSMHNGWPSQKRSFEPELLRVLIVLPVAELIIIVQSRSASSKAIMHVNCACFAAGHWQSDGASFVHTAGYCLLAKGNK